MVIIYRIGCCYVEKKYMSVGNCNIQCKKFIGYEVNKGGYLES